MTSDPSNPHDALVRKLLSGGKDAAAEIRLVAPKEIQESLDWENMEPVDTAFITADLNARYSDLLFRTRLIREPREAYVYVSIEHQSTPDRLMAFRVLEYDVAIIRKHLRDCADRDLRPDRIPAVLSLVVHAGPKGVRWNAPTDVNDLFDLDPETHTAMRDYLPRKRYLLDDANMIDVPTLMARHGTPRSRLSLILVKTTGQGRKTLPAILLSLANDFRQILESPNGKEDFESLVTYLEKVGELKPSELEALADQLGPVAKEILMTTAEMYRTEGKAEGRMEGRVQGLVEGRAELLLKLLTYKFGPTSRAIEQKVRTADAEQMDAWAEQLLTATTIEEALG